MRDRIPRIRHGSILLVNMWTWRFGFTMMICGFGGRKEPGSPFYSSNNWFPVGFFTYWGLGFRWNRIGC